MGQQRALQSVSPPAQQPQRHRVYTVAQVLVELNIARSTFFYLKKRGQLPFLVEVEPRIGRLIRYRADLVDRWTAGQWGTRRFFGSHTRQLRAVSTPQQGNKVARASS